MKSYALYLFIGLVTTNFFTVGTTYALDTFKRSRDLALNSLIPRESLVLAELLVHLKKYLIEITICIFFSVYLGLFNLPAFLLILVLVFSLFLLILGAGCVLLLMNSFISDIAHVWSLAARLFFFITPVFYTLDDIGPWAAKVVYWLNPLTPIIIAIRECLINAGSIEISVIVHAILIGIISFIVGYGLFVKYQDLLVERI
jgi:ABC-2 type transport system permease protein